MANDSSRMWWVDGPLDYDKLVTDSEARLVARGCICDNGELTVTHRIDDRKIPPVVYEQAYHGNRRCPLQP